MWLPSKNQIESYSRYFLSSSSPLFCKSLLNFWWHRCSVWWQTEASRVVEMNVNFIECVWRGGVKSIGFWFGNCIDRVFIGIFYAKERRDMWWYQKSSKREYLPCYVSMNLMNFWYSQLPLSAFHFGKVRYDVSDVEMKFREEKCFCRQSDASGSFAKTFQELLIIFMQTIQSLKAQAP